MKLLRRVFLLSALFALLCACSAPAEDEWPWAIRNGSRDSNQIAITVDDCYDREKVREIFDLCVSEQVQVTFFPLGDQLKAEDAELWREIAESPWAEIGSHTQHHNYFSVLTDDTIGIHLRRMPECLDEVLGYHYQITYVRPPFGNVTDDNGSTKRIRRIMAYWGYDHAILWDVSQTDPDIAIKKVKNGSILLYHARGKDYRCLQKLIPALKEAGFEPVTISTLLGIEGTGIQPEATEEIPPEATVAPADEAV